VVLGVLLGLPGGQDADAEEDVDDGERLDPAALDGQARISDA
jgi:hypothetical protein